VTATRPAGSELLVHLRRARDHIDRKYAAPLDLERLVLVEPRAFSPGDFS
jgi:hypothetical protein